ncbi:hypothetical protein EV702DRAFT_1199622 [Suillus placidus]|uniref:Uncharacterized protein n=1 Tax=Suillus placidus TaxID=48579 RepID=A0A9P7D0Y8_9AGAM|nr:hypothetical protein EV702DRAFT_1199622 [Suillus placidus]
MSTPGPHDQDEGTAPKRQSVTACMCITGSLGIFRSEKGEVAGMIQWDCPQSFHYNYFCPPLNSSPKVMGSTGMNPAPTSILDYERFLHEQIPDIWATYLDWAHQELAPFLSKYANAWPVELYIEHYLSKNTYAKHYDFRIQMTRLRLAPKTVHVESAASERDMSISPAPVGHVSASPTPLGPPPSYEEHDFTHPDSDIASFLKAVNHDLSRLVPAFEELGIWNKEDLIEERFFRERIDGEDE